MENLLRRFDLHSLLLDVEPNARVDIHIEVRHPHQCKCRDEVSAPVFVKQPKTRDEKETKGYVVAEEEFAGE